MNEERTMFEEELLTFQRNADSHLMLSNLQKVEIIEEDSSENKLLWSSQASRVTGSISDIIV